MESMAGVEARVLPGSLAEARQKAETGARTEQLVAVLGKPSLSVRTEGKDSSHEIWTYYFSDGTLVLNITDGVIQRVSADFRPPAIPTSARPK
jgi:hypothetical protein